MWLETALNAIINEVNRQKPLGSASIAVEESPSGTLLKVTGARGGDEPWKITPDGETAGWHQIHVVDQNCNQYTMYVWGGSPKLIL
jgi:hypothetical protein